MKTLQFLSVAAIALAAVCLLPAVQSLATDLAHRAHDVLFGYLVDTGAVLAMTTLAVNKPRDYSLGEIESYPVIATDIIYEGAAVGENASGYARPLAAGDPFLGFALRKADNAAGAAGAVLVEVRTRGRITLPIAALAITANDRPPVYASDDDTFTLTATSNSPIGYVSRWVSTGVAVVEFDAAMGREIAARVAGDA
jgi:hypothetical protein